MATSTLTIRAQATFSLQVECPTAQAAVEALLAPERARLESEGWVLTSEEWDSEDEGSDEWIQFAAYTFQR